MFAQARFVPWRVPHDFELYVVHVWLLHQAGANVVENHVHGGAAHRRESNLNLRATIFLFDAIDQAHIDDAHWEFGIVRLCERAPEILSAHAAIALYPR